jgi:hypothetical protein
MTEKGEVQLLLDVDNSVPTEDCANIPFPFDDPHLFRQI